MQGGGGQTLEKYKTTEHAESSSLLSSPLLSLPPHHFPCPASSALFTSKTPLCCRKRDYPRTPSPPPLPQCSPRVIQVVVPPPLINNRRRIDPNLSTAASTSHVRFCAVKSARVAEALKTSDRRASERSAGQCAPRARLSSPLLGEVNKNFVSEPRPQRTCNCRPTTTTTTPQSPTPSSPLSCPDTYSVLS